MNGRFGLIRAISLLVLVAYQVQAGIRVIWDSPANTFYKQDGVTLLPASSLFLAFWSADTSVGFNPASPESPSGGDVFLGSRNSSFGPPLPGRITGYGSLPDYFVESSYSLPPDYFVGGRVYIAIFDFPYSSYTGPGSIPVGTYYAIAPLTPFGPLADADPGSGSPPPPDAVDYGGITYKTTLQIIPEPGIGVLALAGSLVAVFVRRRQIANGRV